MASSNGCSVCSKGAGTCYCPGCKAYFCHKHFRDHRGMLVDGLDVLTADLNELEEKINKVSLHKQSGSSLLLQIDEWQRITIEKVEHAAEQARQQVLKVMNPKGEEMKREFQTLSREMEQLRETEDVLEQDLTRLKQQMDQLNRDLEQLSESPAVEVNVKQSEQIVWHRMIYIEERSIYPVKQQVHLQPRDPSNTSSHEQKSQARLRSLIEEYTENYSELADRSVKEALEGLSVFRTSSRDQQALIVRDLFTNVLEAKSRARKAVGHLLDAALHEEILSTDAFLSGFKMVVVDASDYTIDIPLIWKYIGEIIGAFIGAPTSNMSLLKPILQYVPEDKSKELFQYIIRYATEFSSKSRIQKFWQSSGFTLNDLIKFDLIDSSFVNEYDWLFDTSESEPSTPQSKDNISPRADRQLVKLFKSVNDQDTTVTDPEIMTYIREHMDPTEKFYIRNIVLSYLEACLINREPQKKIQEDIAKKRMTILNAIIKHKPEAEIQAVYAIQNFVNKLEHPPKMARLLFDIFYDEECVSEDAFFEWLQHPDPSETEGHAVVEMSTDDFFTWLQQAEIEAEEREEEEEWK